MTPKRLGRVATKLLEELTIEVSEMLVASKLACKILKHLCDFPLAQC